MFLVALVPIGLTGMRIGNGEVWGGAIAGGKAIGPEARGLKDSVLKLKESNGGSLSLFVVDHEPERGLLYRVFLREVDRWNLCKDAGLWGEYGYPMEEDRLERYESQALLVVRATGPGSRQVEDYPASEPAPVYHGASSTFTVPRRPAWTT